MSPEIEKLLSQNQQMANRVQFLSKLNNPPEEDIDRLKREMVKNRKRISELESMRQSEAVG